MRLVSYLTSRFASGDCLLPYLFRYTVRHKLSIDCVFKRFPCAESRNFGCRDGDLFTRLWVAASTRRTRAERSRTVKVPKPTRATSTPAFKESVTEAITASKARPAAALEISAPVAILSISCDLFTLSSPLEFYRRTEKDLRLQQHSGYISPVEFW